MKNVKVRNLTRNNPGNNLPKFVKEAAEERGYGDAIHPLSLYVQEADIAEAFACAAQGNGSSCVMAQAGKRLGAKSVYFYRTTAWVDFGEGPLVRFITTKQIYNNVIRPFDEGDRESVTAGIYHLTPPGPGKSLAKRRNVSAESRVRSNSGTRKAVNHAHTERVVMGARAS